MKTSRPIQPRLRLKDRRRRLMWVKVAAGSTVVAVALAAAFYVSRLPNFQITNVEVAGITGAHADSIQNLAKEELSGSYWFIIPKTNAFFAPRSGITASVLSSFPAADQVSISQRDPHTLLVSVTERTPIALWCASLETGEPCYYMDKEGFIYGEATMTDAYIKYYGAVSGGPIGERFPDFSSLHSFIEEAGRTIHRTTDSVIFEPNGDIILSMIGGGELKFIKTEDTRALLDNVASVFASQNFKDGRELEYADFRYGNKVYVKFKGE